MTPIRIRSFLILPLRAIDVLLISRDLLQAASAAARSAHPNEVLLLVHGERTPTGDLHLTHLSLPSGLEVDEDHSNFDSFALPASISYLGVFHSHPVGGAGLSDADRQAASREGGVQLLLAHPYRPSSLVAYAPTGQRLDYQIVL